MKRLRLIQGPPIEPREHEATDKREAGPSPARPLKFPGVFNEDGRIESADRLFAMMDSMSRRIDDLARELNCFGHFADEDDRGPRAA